MLEKTLRGIVIAGAFVLPFIVLIVAQQMFFPYIVGKNFTFRIIVEIMTGAWLALALMYEKYRPRRSWVLGAVALFVLIIAIADAQGAYPFKSFWSNYERMDGWVTLIHFLLYLTAISCVINSERIWRYIFQTSLGVSVFVSLYGLLQLFGYTALGQGGSSGLGARIDATFGNPIYLACYMLFHIAIAALLWVQMWQTKVPGRRLIPSITYGAIIALDTIALFFTGTRGTMLGLIGGTALALLIIAFVQGSAKVRRVALICLALIVVAGIGVKLGKDTALVKSVGFLDRLATISLSDSTIKARFLNMGIALQGVKERPLLGWGQENYAIVFDKYYDPRMVGQEPWFDRVHDILFDWLIAGGIIGLLSYLSIFLAALYTLWLRGAFTFAERAILTGLLAGYFIHNLTVFDNITSYILFATVLGYMVWREWDARKSPNLPHGKWIPESALPFVVIVVAIVTSVGVWWTNANAISANRILLKAVAPQKEGVQKNLDYFKQAIAYGTFGTQEAREQLAQISVQIPGANLPPDIKKQFYDLASSEMTKQEQESPLDARFPLFLGVLQEAYGDYALAAETLKRAHEDSPGKQQILFELAQNAEARQDRDAALAYYKQAYDLLPRYSTARELYAAALIRAGKDDEADEVLAQGLADGSSATPRIAAAYLARNRFDKIVAIWTEYVKVNPKDEKGYYTLAAAYYSMGNKDAAVQALETAMREKPSIQAEAQSLIEQVRAGTAKVQ